ncbi:hypothetical protein [uncultured Shewanella sp.]|uniref:hypothetical protein n=1 Tax=uncultured Shewanella sp. TaxID=173975 RepID=UPI002617B811|nr:hypothetical protein [uncultured Shewanella sp.]
MNKIIVYLALVIIVVCVFSLIFSPRHSILTSSHSHCQFPSNAPHITGTITDFNQYSWQLFIALNWPSKSKLTGQPDCTLSLKDKQQSVWQNYKNIKALFDNTQQTPPKWGGEAPLTLSQLTKVTAQAANLAELQQIGGWLIDQQGHPTYYEIFINQTSFNYIVENKLYDSHQLAHTRKIHFPNSSTHIKASWRPLNLINDDLNRYITKQADIQEFDSLGQKTTQIKNVTLGLVGLHIATKASGYPQWIWSTFEHIDNVPIQIVENNTVVNQPKPSIQYHYYNIHTPSSKVNQSPCLWIERPILNKPSTVFSSLNESALCQPKENISFNTPTPLDRVTPIHEMTNEVNQYQHENNPVNDTVLENYQLIVTQRPSQPQHPHDPQGKPIPKLAANITMESYIQNTSSCIGCHSKAKLPNSQTTSDHSYLFLSIPTAAAPIQ